MNNEIRIRQARDEYVSVYDATGDGIHAMRSALELIGAIDAPKKMPETPYWAWAIIGRYIRARDAYEAARKTGNFTPPRALSHGDPVLLEYREACALLATAANGIHVDSPDVMGIAGQIARWAHCMSYNSSYFGEPEGWLKAQAMQLSRLLPLPPLRAADKCDCQNPDPKSGAALVSNECPIHNDNPRPPPDSERCRLGCVSRCNAEVHGCPSECPDLSKRPAVSS